MSQEKPHLMCTNNFDGTYTCNHCQRTTDINEMENEDCTQEYEDCIHCGQKPFCSPDCVGVWSALTGKGVYVSGMNDIINNGSLN